MTKKMFSICRIIAVIIVSIVVSIFINLGNWYVPVAAIMASWIFLYTTRGKVKEVMADERDYAIAGKASSWAMKIYLSLSVIIGIILYTMGERGDVLFGTATTLLYSACFIMLLYAVIFNIYARKDSRV